MLPMGIDPGPCIKTSFYVWEAALFMGSRTQEHQGNQSVCHWREARAHSKRAQPEAKEVHYWIKDPPLCSHPVPCLLSEPELGW